MEPTRIAQGEEIEWTRTFADFPATLYTLEYRFRGPSTGFNLAADADGTGFRAEIESTAFASTLAVGRWQWQAWTTEIANPSNIKKAGAGFTAVVQGFAADATAPLAKSLAQQIVESIDAATLAFSTSYVQEYEISTPAGTRRVRRSDRKSMSDMRSTYARIWSQEQARDRMASGGGFGQQVRVRTFNNR